MPKGQRSVLALARTLAELSDEDAKLVGQFAKELRGQKSGVSKPRKKRKAKEEAPVKKAKPKKSKPKEEEEEDPAEEEEEDL